MSYRRYYSLIFLAVILIFGSYFFLSLGGLIDEVRFDFGVYTKIAQSLSSGNILYKDAIDTKNAGFLLLFSVFYNFYSIFFPTLKYWLLWNHIALVLVYFCAATMIFHIVENGIKNRLWAFFSAIFYLLYLSILEHAYILNQPQIAQIFVLGLLLLYSYPQPQKYRNLLTGFILGLCFAFSTPYFILVLIAPIIAWIEYRSLKPWFFACTYAFIGFMVALLPFILYFLFHNALADWWYWNFSFLKRYGQIGTQFGVPFLKNIVGIFFTLSHYLQTWSIFSVFFSASIIWILGGAYFLKKQIIFSLSQRNLLIICFFTLIVRLFFEKHHASYNIYLIPFLIIAPTIICYQIREFVSRPKRNACFTILCLWAIVVFKLPATFDETMGQESYDQLAASIITLNNDKSPTFISSVGGVSYSYSTRWKSLGYGALFSSLRWIIHRKPEVLLLNSLPSTNDYLEKLEYPNIYEQEFRQHYPITQGSADFIKQEYTQVSPIMYIHNSKVSEWNTNVISFIDNPFATNIWARKRLTLPDKVKEFLKSHTKDRI